MHTHDVIRWIRVHTPGACTCIRVESHIHWSKVNVLLPPRENVHNQITIHLHITTSVSVNLCTFSANTFWQPWYDLMSVWRWCLKLSSSINIALAVLHWQIIFNNSILISENDKRIIWPCAVTLKVQFLFDWRGSLVQLIIIPRSHSFCIWTVWQKILSS